MNVKNISLLLFVTFILLLSSHKSAFGKCFNNIFTTICTDEVIISPKQRKIGNRYINQVTNKSGKTLHIATSSNREFAYETDGSIYFVLVIEGWMKLRPNETHVWESYEESCYAVKEKNYNTSDRFWVEPRLSPYSFSIDIVDSSVTNTFKALAYNSNGEIYKEKGIYNERERIISGLDRRLIKEGFIKKRAICGTEIDTIIN